MVQRACGAAGFVPDVVAQCTDYASTLAIVRAGGGVALVPELALDADARDGIMIRYTVRPLRRYVSVQRSSGGDTTVAHLFIESLREAGLRVGAS